MKFQVLVFCLLPWIVMGVGVVVTPTVYVMTNLTMSTVELSWFTVSPLIMALGLFAAYGVGFREGRYKESKVK